jgi:hypothetical protein
VASNRERNLEFLITYNNLEKKFNFAASTTGDNFDEFKEGRAT